MRGDVRAEAIADAPPLELPVSARSASADARVVAEVLLMLAREVRALRVELAAAAESVGDAVHSLQPVPVRIEQAAAIVGKTRGRIDPNAEIDGGWITIVPAPGDRCGGSGVLEDGARCPGCRACA